MITDTIVMFKTLLDRHMDMHRMDIDHVKAESSLTWHQVRHGHCRPKGLFLNGYMNRIGGKLDQISFKIFHPSP